MDEFRQAIARVAARAGLDQEAAFEGVSVPKERDRADLTLPCFPFAKLLKKAPPAIAAEVAAVFQPDEHLVSAEAVGPFVNFRLNRPEFARGLLERIDENYGRSDRGAGKTIVIDYGSPNIAKPLLFHHLRSSVIGQTLCNLLRWQGYTLVGLNFLGDVGTAFGKLMVGIEEYGDATTSAQLIATYVKASQGCKDHEAWMERARAWAKRLEDKDPAAVEVWENARRISLEGFATVYDLLGIRHDVVDGEQMYVRSAQALVDTFLKKGVAEESEGGVIIDLGKNKAFLIRKTDGATLYQTRDIAAAEDRWERYRFERMLYVVDVAQEFYFRQLFAALKAIGHEWADRCRHVKFGQVLVEGSRTKTREGGGVLLEDVLQEGIRRARAIVEQKNSDLIDKDRVAEAVGVAAVIFCDVGFPTTKNINFDWDEILSFDGRTGPYLQYVHASAASILRKGSAADRGDPSLLTDQREWDLLRRVAEFPAAVAKAADDAEPSIVSSYLYDLAREFRGYHAAGGRDPTLRVLVDDPDLKAARLRLVSGVKRTLGIGLRLLGIEPLEEM